ncbi:hypothetical protein [Lacinutrix undariae]
MIKDKFTALNCIQNLKFYQVIVYVTFMLSVLVSVFMDKKHLVYILPLGVLSIGLKHIMLCKEKFSIIYCLAIVVIAASDVLAFTGFKSHFIWISILTSLSLVLTSIVLLKYLNKPKFKSVISLSMIIAVLFVGYIIYAVLEALIDYIPGESIFYTFLCTFTLLVFLIIIGLIYINDRYTNGVNLLISGIFTLFQVALTPINELFYYNRTFTVLIVVCHLLSIYMIMIFVSKTKKIDPKNIKEKFV